MAVLRIETYPSPVLKQVSEPVAVVDEEIRRFVSDMAETMYAAGGIGLAANQVGVPKRIFIIDIAGEDEPSQLRTYINPELFDASGEQIFNEGCLSFPGAAEDVKRAATLRVRALDENGQPFELEADGLLAVAIQHENDHINGVLMIDKVGALAKRKISRQVQRALAEQRA